MRDKITLVLELALGSGSVSLWKDKDLLGLVRPDSIVSRSEDVLQHLEHLLKMHSVTINDVDELLCSRGPGGYTGIRIGLATAKGLRRSLGIDVYGYSVMDVLLTKARDGSAAAAIIDAGRRELLAGSSEFNGEANLQIVAVDEIASYLKEKEVKYLVTAASLSPGKMGLKKVSGIEVIHASDNIHELFFQFHRLNKHRIVNLDPIYGREIQKR